MPIEVLSDDQLTETDEEILDLLREGRVTAPYAAEELDASQEYVRSRLRRFVDHGHAHKVYAGLYELVDEPRDGEERQSLVGDREENDPEPHAGAGGESDAADQPNEADQFSSELADVDFPSTKDRADCERVVLAAREHLRENGPATKSEIVRERMPNSSLGYDVDAALEKLDSSERYRGGWWRRVVKPGLEALPDVDAPPTGASDWSASSDDLDDDSGPYDPTGEF